jgi:hypothetical protein
LCQGRGRPHAKGVHGVRSSQHMMSLTALST